MALHVYCPRLSIGARDLVAALGANRLRNFDGMDFWRKRHKVRVGEGDLIVCWGNPLPELDDVKILNGTKALNKFEERNILAQNKITTVNALSNRPKPMAGQIWLPRRDNHVGGSDLLAAPARPDFWVLKESLAREYRLHSFAGKSIRAGVKTPRKSDHHPWIRSFDAGWKIDYDGFKSNEGMRKLAHRAVKALGLTFGAVDLGEREDGSLIVLEVNRAPGIEGGTLEAYVNAVRAWAENPDKVEKASEEKKEKTQQQAAGGRAGAVQHEPLAPPAYPPQQEANREPNPFRQRRDRPR